MVGVVENCLDKAVKRVDASVTGLLTKKDGRAETAGFGEEI